MLMQMYCLCKYMQIYCPDILVMILNWPGASDFNCLDHCYWYKTGGSTHWQWRIDWTNYFMAPGDSVNLRFKLLNFIHTEFAKLWLSWIHASMWQFSKLSWKYFHWQDSTRRTLLPGWWWKTSFIGKVRFSCYVFMSTVKSAFHESLFTKLYW